MWTYTEDGLTADYLQDGGTLSITLDPNGHLSGNIELPPLHFPNRDSVAVVIPVQGSYELGETTVRITAPAVPILNGIQLRFNGGSLAGSILLPGPQASVPVFSYRFAQQGIGADGQMGSNNAGRWADGHLAATSLGISFPRLSSLSLPRRPSAHPPI